MKTEFNKELLISKANLFPVYASAVVEKQIATLSPAGHTFYWFRFDSEVKCTTFEFEWNAMKSHPYTCVISFETMFSNN